MLPNRKFDNLDLEFWANVRLLNQRLGYTKRKSKKNLTAGFVIPSQEQIERVFRDEGLNPERLIQDNGLTKFGHAIREYMKYRGEVLIDLIR